MTSTQQPPQREGRGNERVCNAQLWVIEPDTECPICGAHADEFCFKDIDYD